MKRDGAIAIAGVVALLIVAVLAHRPERPVAATHASDDYAFGGYHAWFDLLAREGVSAARFRRHHDALDDPRATLIVAFPASEVAPFWNAAERDALHAWIRRGGRMIDVGETPAVRTRDESGAGKDSPPERPAGKPPKTTTRAAKPVRMPRGEKVYLEAVRGGGGALRGPWAGLVGALEERGSVRIVPAVRTGVETLLADRAGALAVRYPEGRGEVVALARSEWFENRALARGGAARLAFLAARPPRGGVVLFDEAIRGDIVEKPWYQALTAPELVALAFAGVAGVLWLLYGIVPLGPAVRLRAPREPTSHEFVEAVAALYERAHARDHAREALLRDARRSLERAAPTPENGALRERLARAASAPLPKDDALIAIAQLARAARENTAIMVSDRSPNTRTRRAAFARRLGGAV